MTGERRPECFWSWRWGPGERRPEEICWPPTGGGLLAAETPSPPGRAPAGEGDADRRGERRPEGSRRPWGLRQGAWVGGAGDQGLGGWGLRLGAWDWESPSRAVGVGEWSGGWELGNPKNSYIYSYIWAHMSAGMRVCGFGY